MEPKAVVEVGDEADRTRGRSADGRAGRPRRRRRRPRQLRHPREPARGGRGRQPDAAPGKRHPGRSRILTHGRGHGHRPGRGEHRLRRSARRGRAHDRDRRRRDRGPGGLPGGRAPGTDPRGARRADRLARAGGGRARGPLLRQERPLGDRRRAGARRRHAGGGAARDPQLRLHAAGGEDVGLRQRRGREAPGAADGRHAPRPAGPPRLRPRRRRARGGRLPRQPRPGREDAVRRRS